MRSLTTTLAVMVALGTASHSAAEGWSLRLHAPRPGCVFGIEEAPSVAALVTNGTADEADGALRAELRDAAGDLLATAEARVTVPAGQTREVALRLAEAGGLPEGCYLTVTVTLMVGGRTEAAATKGCGVLQERSVSTPPEASPFGLLAESEWPLLQRLGVRWVRPNWTWDRRFPDWAQRYGVADCAMINQANAFARGEIEEAEYAGFVEESVRRFGGQVHYWQLGNEFDVFHRDGPRAYVEAQRVGYEAAKRADPDCVVVGGSITDLQCRKEGWPESLALGLARYCDVYDFHFYQDLETTQSLLEYIRECCRDAGAEKPLWVTETTQVGMFDLDDSNQADYVFKRYAHFLANGVQVVMWHAMTWPYPYGADKVAATAMIDHKGFARPSLFALAALTRTLEGARFVRRWEAPPGIYGLEFRRGAATRLVLWSEAGPARAEVAVTEGCRVLRPSGDREDLVVTNGQVTVELGTGAVVLESDGAISGTLVQ